MAVLRARAGAAVLAATLAMPAMAADPSLEDAVKATYTYKFAPFVTWPQELRDGPAFLICVDGRDSASALLTQATSGQRVDGRPIVVRLLGPADSEDDCRILYVANSPHAETALSAVKGKPVLTIGSGDGAQRVIIRFLDIDHHVRFDIDAQLAAENRLSISSKLLDLAHAVTPAENRP